MRIGEHRLAQALFALWAALVTLLHYLLLADAVLAPFAAP